MIRDLTNIVSTSAACLKVAVHRQLTADEDMSLHDCLHQLGFHGNASSSDCLLQIARACHQSFAVLHNVLINVRSFKHTSNMEYVVGAFSAMKLVDERHWQNMPFLAMWMLVAFYPSGICESANRML